ncbi:MAG TPA: tetratricopeptide repeat protein, partial [Gemmatimonadaceae bacterium]|nr:tetratricopeptide repeat protein [Gemmatimonadaceae bacterium]
MTAGLPGVGIGGMFYVLSAIAMPFHAAYQAVRRRRDPILAGEPPVRWGLVFRQLTIALGIIGALWVTGWALGALLVEHPSALGGMEATVSGRTAPNAIKVSALVLSFGTMCIVLMAVQITRLFLGPKRRKTGTVVAVVGALLLSASGANAQTTKGRSPLAARIDAAERTYQAGDSAAAVAAYGTVLALDPNNSRALFRLGQLWRHDPKRSLPMFRRYTSVVPNDAWGHMALGDALAADGNFSEALREYDEARRIAPKERDVALGHARVMGRAGRGGDAVALLQKWAALHPRDLEATREIGVQQRLLSSTRAKHAPAVELTASSGGDSDGNRSYGAVALISTQLTDNARLSASAGRKRSAGFLDAVHYDGTVALTVRPSSAFRLEAVAGAVRTTRNESFEYPDTAQVVPRPGRGKGRREQPTPPAIVRTDSAFA